MSGLIMRSTPGPVAEYNAGSPWRERSHTFDDSSGSGEPSACTAPTVTAFMASPGGRIPRTIWLACTACKAATRADSLSEVASAGMEIGSTWFPALMMKRTLYSSASQSTSLPTGLILRTRGRRQSPIDKLMTRTLEATGGRPDSPAKIRRTAR